MTANVSDVNAITSLAFVVNGVRPDISVRDIFKGIWPFIFADTITLAILTAFPEIVTFIVEVSD